MNVKTYRIMTDAEFDLLVMSTYGADVRYEFVAAEEAHNYCSYTYNNIERGKELDGWDAGKLDSLKNGKWVGSMAYTLIQDMVNKEVLDPGNYMIEVYW